MTWLDTISSFLGPLAIVGQIAFWIVASLLGSWQWFKRRSAKKQAEIYRLTEKAKSFENKFAVAESAVESLRLSVERVEQRLPEVVLEDETGARAIAWLDSESAAVSRVFHQGAERLLAFVPTAPVPSVVLQKADELVSVAIRLNPGDLHIHGLKAEVVNLRATVAAEEGDHEAQEFHLEELHDYVGSSDVDLNTLVGAANSYNKQGQYHLSAVLWHRIWCI